MNYDLTPAEASSSSPKLAPDASQPGEGGAHGARSETSDNANTCHALQEKKAAPESEAAADPSQEITSTIRDCDASQTGECVGRDERVESGPDSSCVGQLVLNVDFAPPRPGASRGRRASIGRQLAKRASSPGHLIEVSLCVKQRPRGPRGGRAEPSSGQQEFEGAPGGSQDNNKCFQLKKNCLGQHNSSPASDSGQVRGRKRRLVYEPIDRFCLELGRHSLAGGSSGKPARPIMLPFKNGTFDACFCFNLLNVRVQPAGLGGQRAEPPATATSTAESEWLRLERLTTQLRLELLNEMSRVVKSEGKIMVTVFAYECHRRSAAPQPLPATHPAPISSGTSIADTPGGQHQCKQLGGDNLDEPPASKRRRRQWEGGSSKQQEAKKDGRDEPLALAQLKAQTGDAASSESKDNNDDEGASHDEEDRGEENEDEEEEANGEEPCDEDGRDSCCPQCRLDSYMERSGRQLLSARRPSSGQVEVRQWGTMNFYPRRLPARPSEPHWPGEGSSPFQLAEGGLKQRHQQLPHPSASGVRPSGNLAKDCDSTGLWEANDSSSQRWRSLGLARSGQVKGEAVRGDEPPASVDPSLSACSPSAAGGQQQQLPGANGASPTSAANLANLSRRYSAALWRATMGKSGGSLTSSGDDLLSAAAQLQLHRDSIGEAAKKIGRRLSLGGASWLSRLFSQSGGTSSSLELGQQQAQSLADPQSMVPPATAASDEPSGLPKCDIRIQESGGCSGGDTNQSGDTEDENQRAMDKRHQMYLTSGADVMSLFQDDEYAKRHRQSIAVQTFFTKSIEMNADEEDEEDDAERQLQADRQFSLRADNNNNNTGDEKASHSNRKERENAAGLSGQAGTTSEEQRQRPNELLLQFLSDDQDQDRDQEVDEEAFDESTSSGWTAPTTNSLGPGDSWASETALGGAVRRPMAEATSDTGSSQAERRHRPRRREQAPRSASSGSSERPTNRPGGKLVTQGAPGAYHRHHYHHLHGQSSKHNASSTHHRATSPGGSFAATKQDKKGTTASGSEAQGETLWRIQGGSGSSASEPRAETEPEAEASLGPASEERINSDFSSFTLNTTTTTTTSESAEANKQGNNNGTSPMAPIGRLTDQREVRSLASSISNHRQVNSGPAEPHSFAGEPISLTATGSGGSRARGYYEERTSTNDRQAGEFVFVHERAAMPVQPAAKQVEQAKQQHQRRAFSETEASEAARQRGGGGVGAFFPLIQATMTAVKANTNANQATALQTKADASARRLPPLHLLECNPGQIGQLNEPSGQQQQQAHSSGCAGANEGSAASSVSWRQIRSAESAARYAQQPPIPGHGGGSTTTSSSSASAHQPVNNARSMQRASAVAAQAHAHRNASDSARQLRQAAEQQQHLLAAFVQHRNLNADSNSSNCLPANNSNHHSMTNLIGTRQTGQSSGSQQQQQQHAPYAPFTSADQCEQANAPAAAAPMAGGQRSVAADAHHRQATGGNRAAHNKQQWCHSATFSSSLNSDISTTTSGPKDTTEKDSSRRTSTLSGISSIYQQEISLGQATPGQHSFGVQGAAGGTSTSASSQANMGANMGSIPELATLDHLGQAQHGPLSSAHPPMGSQPSGALAHSQTSNLPGEFHTSEVGGAVLNTSTWRGGEPQLGGPQAQRRDWQPDGELAAASHMLLAGQKAPPPSAARNSPEPGSGVDFADQLTGTASGPINLQRVAQSLRSQLREHMPTMRSINAFMGLNGPNEMESDELAPAFAETTQVSYGGDPISPGQAMPGAPSPKDGEQAQLKRNEEFAASMAATADQQAEQSSIQAQSTSSSGQLKVGPFEPYARHSGQCSPQSHSGGGPANRPVRGHSIGQPNSGGGVDATPATPATLKSFFRSTSSAAFNAFASSFQHQSSSSTPTANTVIMAHNLSTSSQHFASGSQSSDVFDTCATPGALNGLHHQLSFGGQSQASVNSPQPHSAATEPGSLTFEYSIQLQHSPSTPTPASAQQQGQQQQPSVVVPIGGVSGPSRSPLSPIFVSPQRFFARIRDKFSLSPTSAASATTPTAGQSATPTTGSAGPSPPGRPLSSASNSASLNAPATVIQASRFQQQQRHQPQTPHYPDPSTTQADPGHIAPRGDGGPEGVPSCADQIEGAYTGGDLRAQNPPDGLAQVRRQQQQQQLIQGSSLDTNCDTLATLNDESISSPLSGSMTGGGGGQGQTSGGGATGASGGTNNTSGGDRPTRQANGGSSSLLTSSDRLNSTTTSTTTTATKTGTNSSELAGESASSSSSGAVARWCSRRPISGGATGEGAGKQQETSDDGEHYQADQSSYEDTQGAAETGNWSPPAARAAPHLAQTPLAMAHLSERRPISAECSPGDGGQVSTKTDTRTMAADTTKAAAKPTEQVALAPPTSLAATSGECTAPDRRTINHTTSHQRQQLLRGSDLDSIIRPMSSILASSLEPQGQALIQETAPAACFSSTLPVSAYMAATTTGADPNYPRQSAGLVGSSHLAARQAAPHLQQTPGGVGVPQSAIDPNLTHRWIESSQQSIDSSSSARSLRSCWFSMPELYAMNHDSSSQSPSGTTTQASGMGLPVPLGAVAPTTCWPTGPSYTQTISATHTPTSVDGLVGVSGISATRHGSGDTFEAGQHHHHHHQLQQQQQQQQQSRVAESWLSNQLYKQVTCEAGQNWSLSDLNLTSDDIAPGQLAAATAAGELALLSGGHTRPPMNKMGQSQQLTSSRPFDEQQQLANHKQLMTELIKCSTLDDSVCASMKSSNSSRGEPGPPGQARPASAQNGGPNAATPPSPLVNPGALNEQMGEQMESSRPTSQNSTISNTSCALSDLNSSDLQDCTRSPATSGTGGGLGTNSGGHAHPWPPTTESAPGTPPSSLAHTTEGGLVTHTDSGPLLGGRPPRGGAGSDLHQRQLVPATRQVRTMSLVAGYPVLSERATPSSDRLSSPELGEGVVRSESESPAGGGGVTLGDSGGALGLLDSGRCSSALLGAPTTTDSAASPSTCIRAPTLTGGTLSTLNINSDGPRRRHSARGNLTPSNDVAPAATTLDLRLAGRKNRVKLTDLHPITFINDRAFLNSMNSLKKASNNKLDAIFNGPVGRRLSVNAELAQNSPFNQANGKSGIKIGLTGYVYLESTNRTRGFGGGAAGANWQNQFRRPSLAPNFWLAEQNKRDSKSDGEFWPNSRDSMGDRHSGGDRLAPGSGPHSLDPNSRPRPRAASCTPIGMLADPSSSLSVPLSSGTNLRVATGGPVTAVELDPGTTGAAPEQVPSDEPLSQSQMAQTAQVARRVSSGELMATAENGGSGVQLTGQPYRPNVPQANFKPSVGGYHLDKRRSTIAMLSRLSESSIELEAAEQGDQIGKPLLLAGSGSAFAAGPEAQRLAHRKSISCLRKIGEHEELHSGPDGHGESANASSTNIGNNQEVAAGGQQRKRTPEQMQAGRQCKTLSEAGKHPPSPEEAESCSRSTSGEDEDDGGASSPSGSLSGHEQRTKEEIKSQPQVARNKTAVNDESSANSSSSSDDGDLEKLCAQYPDALGRPLAHQHQHQVGPGARARGNLKAREERVVKNDMILRQLLLAANVASLSSAQAAHLGEGRSGGPQNVAHLPSDLRRFSAINLYQRDEDIFVANSMKRLPTSGNPMQVLNALPLLAGTLPVLTHPGASGQVQSSQFQFQGQQQQQPLHNQLPILSGQKTGIKSIISGTSGLMASSPATSQPQGDKVWKEQQAATEQQRIQPAVPRPWQPAHLGGTEVDIEEQLNRLRQQERRSQAFILLGSSAGSTGSGGQPAHGSGAVHVEPSDEPTFGQVDSSGHQDRQVELQSCPKIKSPPPAPAAQVPTTSTATPTTTSFPVAARPEPLPYGSSGSKSCEPAFKQLDTIIEGRGLLLGAEQQADPTYANRLRRLSSNSSRRASASGIGPGVGGGSLQPEDEWCRCDLSPTRRLSEGRRLLARARSRQRSARKRSESGSTPGGGHVQAGGVSSGSGGPSATPTSTSRFVFDTVRSLARRTLNNFATISSSASGPRLNEQQEQQVAAAPSGRVQRSSSVIATTNSGQQLVEAGLASRMLRERARLGTSAGAVATSTGGRRGHVSARRANMDVNGRAYPYEEAYDEVSLGDEDEAEEELAVMSSSSSVTGSPDDSSLISLDDAENYRTKNKDNKMAHGRSLESSSSSTSISSTGSTISMGLEELEAGERRARSAPLARKPGGISGAGTASGGQLDDSEQKSKAEQEAKDNHDNRKEDEEDDDDDDDEPKVCYRCNKKIRMAEPVDLLFEADCYDEEEVDDEDEDADDRCSDWRSGGKASVGGQPGGSQAGSGVSQQQRQSHDQQQNQKPQHDQQQPGSVPDNARAGHPSRIHRSSSQATARGHHGRTRRNQQASSLRSASMNSGEFGPDSGIAPASGPGTPGAGGSSSAGSQHVNRRKNKWQIQRNLAPKLKRQRSFSANYAPEVPNPVMPPPRRFSAAPNLSCPHRTKHSSSHSSSSIHRTYSIDSSESMITVIPANPNQAVSGQPRASRGSLSHTSGCGSQSGGLDGAAGSFFGHVPKSPLSPRSPSRCSPSLLTPNTSEPPALIESLFSPAPTTGTNSSGGTTNSGHASTVILQHPSSPQGAATGCTTEQLSAQNRQPQGQSWTRPSLTLSEQPASGQVTMSGSTQDTNLSGNLSSAGLSLPREGGSGGPGSSDAEEDNSSLAVENGTCYSPSRNELDEFEARDEQVQNREARGGEQESSYNELLDEFNLDATSDVEQLDEFEQRELARAMGKSEPDLGININRLNETQLHVSGSLIFTEPVSFEEEEEEVGERTLTNPGEPIISESINDFCARHSREELEFLVEQIGYLEISECYFSEMSSTLCMVIEVKEE